MKQLLCGWVALALVVVVTGRAVSQPAYSYATLDVPGSILTEGYGINDAGEVAGTFWKPLDNRAAHGFLYSGGSYTLFDVPGSTTTYGYGINSSGQVVGGFFATANIQAYVRSGGSYTTLNIPGSDAAAAQAINSSGQIVGFYESNNIAPVSGFLYSGGSYQSLLGPAYGINSYGQIVGSFGLYSNGSYTPLNVPGLATGINDAGDIVGTFQDGINPDHGFLYHNGSYLTVDVPGALRTDAYGINNAGQIVGYYVDASGGHAFIATPTPEPSTIVLLALGTLGLIGYRWARYGRGSP
ncbi:MAG TPA: PEP-CTERM sorting domain-containing protein [Gemmataceae bacterium]|nr:PEP-CTERM sorting domain-containing protein [Gemmataceae bacterium]